MLHDVSVHQLQLGIVSKAVHPASLQLALF